MILDTTKALEGDREWIVQAMAHAVAVSDNMNVLEYVHNLASLAEKATIAGSVLKARAGHSRWKWIEDDAISNQSSGKGDNSSNHSATSWDEIDVQTNQPHAKEDETSVTTWTEQPVFEKFILPYSGVDSFKRSLNSTFHMLAKKGQYKAGAELLRKYPDAKLIISDPNILQSVLQHAEDMYCYTNDERRTSYWLLCAYWLKVAPLSIAGMNMTRFRSTMSAPKAWKIFSFCYWKLELITV